MRDLGIEGQFFNLWASLASAHHWDPSPPGGTCWATQGSDLHPGSSWVPDSRLQGQGGVGGQDGGPDLTPEVMAHHPIGTPDSSDTASSSSKISWWSPLGTLIFGLCFLRLVTSQRQNLASQQGLQAYQTPLPESQRRAEIVRKKLPAIEPKPLKPLERWHQLSVPSHFPWPGHGHSWGLCWAGGQWSTQCSLWRRLWWCSEQECQS